MQPKVSVLMTVYNEEATIKATLDSVLMQTLSDIEIIILDDGSKDGTFEIVREYGSKDPRIRVVVNEKNLGVAASSSKGVKECSGKYIAVADSGDIFDPTRFEKQAGFLDNNPDVYIVGCFHHWINKEGKIIDSYVFPTDKKNIKSHIFGFGAVAAHACIMVRRELFDKTGPYDASLKTSMDYELYMRVLASGFYIVNIPEYLVSALRRGEGISLSKNREIFRDMFRIRMRYLPKMFSVKNAFYTAVSFFVMLLPRSVLKKAVTSRLWSKKVRNIALKA